jgi:hypothetical protein
MLLDHAAVPNIRLVLIYSDNAAGISGYFPKLESIFFFVKNGGAIYTPGTVAWCVGFLAA